MATFRYASGHRPGPLRVPGDERGMDCIWGEMARLDSKEGWSEGLEHAGFVVFETHWGSETQKCRFRKGLGGG